MIDHTFIVFNGRFKCIVYYHMMVKMSQK